MNGNDQQKGYVQSAEFAGLGGHAKQKAIWQAHGCCELAVTLDCDRETSPASPDRPDHQSVGNDAVEAEEGNAVGGFHLEVVCRIDEVTELDAPVGGQHEAVVLVELMVEGGNDGDSDDGEGGQGGDCPGTADVQAQKRVEGWNDQDKCFAIPGSQCHDWHEQPPWKAQSYPDG